MKILHLTLKKKWFDMIDRGEKLEEYREVKPYWIQRLVGHDESPRHYDLVTFYHGYKPGRPTMTFKVREILLTYGFLDWGADRGKKYFVIKLDERV